MNIQPYLFFNGRADDAIAFYRDALGAEVQMLLRHKESPEPPPPGLLAPGWGEKIMHATLKIGDGILHCSDGCGADSPSFASFGLSAPAKDAAEAERIFAAVSDGGEVRMPLCETFFATRFGMVVDRFGVLWMVIVPK